MQVTYPSTYLWGTNLRFVYPMEQISGGGGYHTLLQEKIYSGLKNGLPHLSGNEIDTSKRGSPKIFTKIAL